MFERRIGHGHDQLVRRLAVRLNNNGAIFALGHIEQGPEPLEREPLVAKINRGDRAAGDADDLLILLRAEQERRGWRRNSDPRLEDKVRAQQEKKDKQKDHVDEREHDEPAEIILLGAAELHICAPLLSILRVFATANPSFGGSI